jgi:hypothetical protein
MVVSLSHAFDAARPAEVMGGAPRYQTLEPAIYRRDQATENRIRLDLREPVALAQLRQTSLIWPELSDAQQQAWLSSLDIMLPPAEISNTGIAVLPGGAVALRGPDAMLVCDPVEGAIFNHAEVKQVRRLLRGREDVISLLHAGTGVMLHRRVPKRLPPQAVSIVPGTSKLPFRVSFNGPALIQWGSHGAVARPLVAATGLLALAASLAASPQEGRGGSVIVADTWRAGDASDRCRLIAVALMEHLSDLVAGTICDDLRLGLMQACIDGPYSLAARVAKALAVLPACFVADPDCFPGNPPSVWRCAMAHIRNTAHPRALLGLDKLTDPLTAIRSLRDTLEHAEVMAFSEFGDVLPGGPVELHSDAALFLARKAGSDGRLGVAIPTPASPLDLYTVAHEVALVSGGRIIAVAPDWGFCHRLGPDGEETGNAGWFGMGVGLDEVDDILVDA